MSSRAAGAREVLQHSQEIQFPAVEAIGNHISGTDISSAVVLSPPDEATKLLIQTTDQAIRYTLDGTTPTASIGFRLVTEDPPVIIPVISNQTITVIEESATAVIQYMWGR